MVGDVFLSKWGVCGGVSLGRWFGFESLCWFFDGILLVGADVWLMHGMPGSLRLFGGMVEAFEIKRTLSGKQDIGFY
ncbi:MULTISPECIES: hypothetical protein [Bartonella]|uniref:hypothetical protein n=1 Tax=Bartonella TaxID=773 RepID=UPI0023615F2C|nr:MULTISPECIES: hypothetical protein [Bartonella]